MRYRCPGVSSWLSFRGAGRGRRIGVVGGLLRVPCPVWRRRGPWRWSLSARGCMPAAPSRCSRPMLAIGSSGEGGRVKVTTTPEPSAVWSPAQAVPAPPHRLVCGPLPRPIDAVGASLAGRSRSRCSRPSTAGSSSVMVVRIHGPCSGWTKTEPVRRRALANRRPSAFASEERAAGPAGMVAGGSVGGSPMACHAHRADGESGPVGERRGGHGIPLGVFGRDMPVRRVQGSGVQADGPPRPFRRSPEAGTADELAGSIIGLRWLPSPAMCAAHASNVRRSRTSSARSTFLPATSRCPSAAASATCRRAERR